MLRFLTWEPVSATEHKAGPFTIYKAQIPSNEPFKVQWKGQTMTNCPTLEDAKLAAEILINQAMGEYISALWSQALAYNGVKG